MDVNPFDSLINKNKKQKADGHKKTLFVLYSALVLEFKG